MAVAIKTLQNDFSYAFKQACQVVKAINHLDDVMHFQNFHCFACWCRKHGIQRSMQAISLMPSQLECHSMYEVGWYTAILLHTLILWQGNGCKGIRSLLVL